MEARMDGTLEQRLRWRISALREALTDVTTMTDPKEAAHLTAKNALGVDSMNAERCKGGSPRPGGGRENACR